MEDKAPLVAFQIYRESRSLHLILIYQVNTALCSLNLQNVIEIFSRYI